MQKSELGIPPGVSGDAKAMEIARIWVAHGSQHVRLRVDKSADPAIWGLLLVDLARHVANAYAQQGVGDPIAVLGRIREGLDVEFGHPTDGATGNMVT